MNTTLIIDGNWLLMSRLFACKSYFDVQNDETERKEGTAALEDLLCKSINLVINRFECVVDNFVIVGRGSTEGIAHIRAVHITGRNVQIETYIVF